MLAVPGEITSQLSKGTNHLLRLGASPVTCVGDVLRVLGLQAATAATPVPLEPRLAAVRALVADAPTAPDEIVRKTGMTAAVRRSRPGRARAARPVAHADGSYREVMTQT